MTFRPAPLALDGASTPAALQRKGNYASVGGAEGIVERTHLKVTQLATPGVGLLISDGTALVKNRYQSSPNETYVVSNEGTQTVLSTEMPTPQPTAKSYLVLITVGDPEFNQTNHPWMTSEALSAEDAVEYQYVRPWLLEVAPGTKSFASLGLNYPALTLARLTIPANTTTITNSMITDLRKMARPRSEEWQQVVNTSNSNGLNVVAPEWEWFGTNILNVDIPAWATVAKINAWIESAVVSAYVNGNLRVSFGDHSAATTPIPYNLSTPSSGEDRLGFNLGGNMNVASFAGQSKTVRIEGQVGFQGSNQNALSVDEKTSSSITIRFEEAPI